MDNLTFKYVRYVSGALIGSLGAIASGLFSQSSQERMVDKMNEYNDPKMQIKRLRNAGINPAYLLGQGAESLSGNQPSPAAGADFDIVPSAVQAELVKSQVHKNEAEANNLNSQTPLNEVELEFKRDLLAGQLKFVDAETQSYLKGLGLTDAQIKVASAEYDKYIAEVDEINAHRDELAASANKMNEEAALYQLRQTLERELADSEIAKNNAAIEELASACYANTKRGDLDSLAGDAQRIINKYVEKNERIKQTTLQYGAQKAGQDVKRVKADTKAQELQNAREEASQGLETFTPFAWLRSTYRSVGQVFGGQASVGFKPKE